ncbi:DUF4180 domain-containing protein [Rhodocytophaga aerolata]|uniref:DUF4180 domain-containing protein n=1 Tax=Rhodocytophaga aerolata TaxID=455078 RepID=A0ABT8RG91_9BACT|nr:DUF4180 domain-containing protein [Rhodocytophaga aerolata]MDO1451130.1 DUF4180 domain-containing protein [Rhodocytophaga aerolata]
MRIEIREIKGITLAEVISESLVIGNLQDALELIGNCGYQGVDKVIVQEHNITPDFFDLKTGLAGEVLQKFSTYGLSIAIIGDFSKYSSKSLQDFIYESNKSNRVNFFPSVQEVKERLISTSH